MTGHVYGHPSWLARRENTGRPPAPWNGQKHGNGAAPSAFGQAEGAQAGGGPQVPILQMPGLSPDQAASVQPDHRLGRSVPPLSLTREEQGDLGP